MAGITVSGIGSGLNISELVEQLVAAEGDPQKARLDLREAELTAEISAMGTLRSALAGFQTSTARMRSASTLTGIAAGSSQPEAFTASASSVAAAGSYSIEVSTLAQAQKLASKAFTDPTDAVGEGTLTFRFGAYDPDTNTFTANPDAATASVVIEPGNGSLQGIRDAINGADIGVRASLVNDGSGYRLVLASTATGAANGLQISVADSDGNGLDDAGLSQLAFDPTAAAGSGKNMTETAAARDAELRVDGLTITRASNTITGVVDGVTLQLLATTGASPGSLSVYADEAAVTEAVKGFVEGFNGLAATLGALTRFDPETGEAGILIGDPLVRGIESQLRRIMSDTVEGLSGPFRSLADIGLRTQADGSLSLDAARLSAAMDADPRAVARIFGSGGTASDPLVDYVGASSRTQAGRFGLEVTQLASQGRYTGAAAGGFPLTVDADNDTLAVRVDGIQSTTITLAQGSYASTAELAAEIQGRINGDSQLRAAGVSVAVAFSVDRFEITSTRFGSASQVAIAATDTQTATTLGIGVGMGVSTVGVDVAGAMGGVQASGSGRLLSGSGAADGLEVEVRGGAAGSRGTVEYSLGVADRLYRLLDGYLGDGSLIAGQLESLDGRKAEIGEERAALDARLDRLETRLTSEFVALDALVAELTQTSDFLTAQLAQLPGNTTNRR